LTKTLTHGSLFSGIGGFDLGFERAGIRTLWQIEIDDYCNGVLARHFPSAARFRDVRECGAHNLSPVDIISGGFPCQDISNAGKRAGIDGERSGLWAEYARIVRELRPRFVVVENVAALLHRGLERVCGDLAACGYDAEWDCLPASAFGAPHRRDRLWLIAYPSQHGRHEKFAESRRFFRALRLDGRGDPLADANSAGFRERCGAIASAPAYGPAQCGSEDVSHTASGRAESGGASGHEWGFQNETLREFRYSDNWATEPDVGRVAHGIPARVDRLRGLGNAVVPQITEWLGRKIVTHSQACESKE
jgi:DNA (cytosine-5)-methyltransferase 1